MNPSAFARLLIAVAMLHHAPAARSEDAPAPTYVGTLYGTDVFIPAKFARATFVNFIAVYNDPHVASDFKENKVKPGRIVDMRLSLRRSNYEPMVSKADEMEYRAHSGNYEGVEDPKHDWFDITIEPTIGMEQEYDDLKFAGKAECGKKIIPELVYCRRIGKIPTGAITEYFYDDKTKASLILCKPEVWAKRSCMHQFSAGAPNAMVTTRYTSMAQIKRWREVEAGTRRAIAAFFVQPE